MFSRTRLTLNLEGHFAAVAEVDVRRHVGSLVHPELAAEDDVVLDGGWAVDVDRRQVGLHGHDDGGRLLVQPQVRGRTRQQVRTRFAGEEKMNMWNSRYIYL